ncbi:unnamed protein product [Heterobilharzia americana]|nr:unnamed protein product [Heterobilharzia americana]
MFQLFNYQFFIIHFQIFSDQVLMYSMIRLLCILIIFLLHMIVLIDSELLNHKKAVIRIIRNLKYSNHESSITHNLLQSQHYQCIPMFKDIHELTRKSELIIAGRLKYHDKNVNYNQVNNNYYFNITVIITIRYKTDYPIDNQITIGPIFIPNDKHKSGKGCLSVFYGNAKYIFFLKKYPDYSNYYEPLCEAIEYSEYTEKKIYTHYCPNCVKPMIESIPNQVSEYGYAVTVSCIATGTPTPNIIWIRDGKSLNLADKSLRIETFERSLGNVESILEIHNLILIDTGEYWCYAENALGIAKQKFLLKVKQSNSTKEKAMTDELIPCSDEHKDYCLNGGQCYTYKNERVSFQCSCYTPYYGSKCERVAVDLNEYKSFAESRENDLQSMLHELATTLTLRGIFFTLFGASISVLTFYGIWKCQQRSMQRKHLKKRSRSGFKGNSQTKISQSVNSMPRSKVLSIRNNGTEPFLITDYSTRDQKNDSISIPEDYYLGQNSSNNCLLPTSNLFNNGCYENRSQNCMGVSVDLNPTSSTNQVFSVTSQQSHEQIKDGLPIGYRPSSSLDPCNDMIHKFGNDMKFLNRPITTDWHTRRYTSQKVASTRDRLPVLAENSNIELNIERYPNYTNSMNRLERLNCDRELPLNLISSSSSFIQPDA